MIEVFESICKKCEHYLVCKFADDETGACSQYKAQTIDATEVVRCKDCEHWNEGALACDTLPWVNSAEHAAWYSEDFCSYGKRKN